MKKTVNINISGIIFHIDEDAYDRLNHYLSTIKSYFTNAEGRDEIITDIESRISELLQEKLDGGKQVISIADIDEIITVMGEPEQIGAENTNNTHKEQSESEFKQKKRLYRDPDNKVLGGVCSGIASYFNTDPIWIRIAFVVALFLIGSSILIYILLWMIIPKAITTAEKLEMKGEPINISNIEKSIKEEIDGLKKNFHNLKEEAKETYAKNFRKQQPPTAAEKVADFFLLIGKYLIRSILIFLGLIFIIIGIFLIIGFITSLLNTNDLVWVSSMGVSSFSIPIFLRLLLSSPQQITLAIIGLILFVGIPLIMLIYNGIKLIFGYTYKKRIIGVSSFTLWFAGLIICLVVSVTILKSFAQRATISKKTELIQPKNNMLKVYMNPKTIIDSISEYENKFEIGQWNMISINNETFRFGLPDLKIVSSENNFYQLQINYSSKGSSKEEATNRIQKIEYNALQNDTSLVLDPYYILKGNEKWRNQNIKIIIKVPIWKTIYISPEASRLLKSNNDNYETMKDLAGKQWIMTENGLKEYMANPLQNALDTLK